MHTRTQAHLVLALLLSLLLPAAPAAGQQAVVLSGGGARGLAHIGVLLRMDTLGYDPDLVVGNSMGAVVGALYAAGYSPEEIRERVLAVQWGGMFDPSALVLGPGRTLRTPLLSFSLDLAERQVSRGLFGEWRINRTLVQLLFDANARARGDFDRLARRYRAVAADLKTGERVVLASGDVARAARASMAYPGFFAPVRWGERVLVDGGIVDNLPTEVARQLGATHIVAVDVSRPAAEIGSLEALSVAGRALNLMQQSLHPDPLPPDVLVLPSTEAALAGPAFPDDPLPLIELGYETALEALPPAPPRGGTTRVLPAVPERFGALRIEAPDSTLAAFARQVLGRLAPGAYDQSALLSALDRLYGTGLFEGIWPDVSNAGPGEPPALVVRLQPAPRLALALGAGFDNDRGGRAWAALDRHAAFLRRPATWSAAASTDGLQRWGALSLRVHSFARPTLAWSLGTHLQEHSVHTFTDDTRTTVEVRRAGGWLGLEFPHILRDRVLTLTGRAEWLDPEDAPGGGAFGPLLRLAGVPSQAPLVGAPLLLEAEARWGDRPYRRAAGTLSLASIGRTRQAAALLDVRVVSARAPLDVQPALGDERAIPGLRWGERRGRARVVAGADGALAAPMGGMLRLRLRSGAVAPEPADWDAVRWVTGAELGGVWRIPFGTLEVGYGLATVGDGRVHVGLGKIF